MPTADATDLRFRLTEEQARRLATEFGTPLYVLDETSLRERIREFVVAARRAYANSQVSYASKANSTLAVLAIAHQEGCSLDVASEGEFRAALAAGVPPQACYLHGNNKSRQELSFAIEQGIGAIVIDHFGEIEMLKALASNAPHCPQLLLRLAPGVDPKTHEKIATGQADTKFGFNIADGAALRAAERTLKANLPLAGFHCHVGSQLMDSEAQTSGAELIARFAIEAKATLGFVATVLNVGGGLGVRYTDSDRPEPVDSFCQNIAAAVRATLRGSSIDPILIFEPGRSLVAESGVTLYTVGVVKTVPVSAGKTRTYVAVDGGLSDNPRPALYGAKYSVERVAPPPAGPTRVVTVSGRHCETDRLIAEASLPEDIAPGNLVQVLTTGAYASSMASNYNRYPRPATVLVRPDGEFRTVQVRETFDSMLAREVVPDDLGRER
ncbi:MAG: diaminopimelate decarboxylase [Fimbriimonadaceae bacterium]|nr:diaminopimelate decarboxylase [Fimbriimonadaceae bacterium]